MRSRLVILIWATWLGCPAHLAAKTVRAGMFVGTSVGNFTEDVLFYATEDAWKMYLAFLGYGRLDKRLSFLLRDSDTDEIRTQLESLEQRIQLVKEHNDFNVECIFYYSGHGGTDGLHIEGQTYAYGDLHRDLLSLSCDLLIVIVDACNSGNVINFKGVNFSPEEFRVKIYDSRQGEVFVTSSADSEYSQERDEFKGSVFTYYLVNGLVGAADVNRDGLVTLSEAYNFASKKTIQETFGSARGFQVPTYRYEVRGSQDTVLTELNETELVYAPKGRDGIMTFMDIDKGIIWGDFAVGRENRKIFVPRGRYLVRLRRSDGKLYLAECNVTANRQDSSWGKFRVISEAQDPLKGERVRHRWLVRFCGDALWSPDNPAIRSAHFGGSLAILIDNLIFPPLYGGLALGITTGSSSESVFETEVRYSSLLVMVEGVLGLGRRIGDTFEISGELRIGGGHASLDRTLAGGFRHAGGYVFRCGLWGQTIWWLSRDIGLLLPALHASLLTYEKSGSFHNSVDVGASAGFQFRF